MINKLIGRNHEQKQLQDAFNSKDAELIAIYGRRRIGKTFLIKNFFKQQKCIFFQVIGIKNGSLKTQLTEFRKEVEQTFYTGRKGTKLQTPSNWMDAFEMLTDAIEIFGNKTKFVLFFDELPWMATKKSRLLQAIDYYWNRYWVDNNKIKLIVCGSAASWIIDNLLNNKGGLYNRVTLRIRLEPFTLRKTQAYLKHRNIKLTNHQILQLYMCVGGVPYYLKLVKNGLSAIQNINQMCFYKKGTLSDEFANLFSSLFDHSEAHKELIKLIASKRTGIARQKIEEKVSLSKKGGTLTKRLRELEEAGFIMSFIPQGKEKGIFYKIIDEYTLFYLTWIAPDASNRISKEINDKYWEEISQTIAWKTWAGYAFEAVCYKHLTNIRKALHIHVGASAFTWKHMPARGKSETGAQIDLLFDRNDGVLNLCEIKYCNKPFIIDKKCANDLINKADVYRKITKTEKQIFISMVTSCRLKKNMYSEELIASEATLDDFFKDWS